MVFRYIQRVKVVPLGFDLRALGYLKTHGAENVLSSSLHQGNGVQMPSFYSGSRRSYVKRFLPFLGTPLLQLLFLLFENNRKRGLCLVCRLSRGFALCLGKFSQRAQKQGQLPF